MSMSIGRTPVIGLEIAKLREKEDTADIYASYDQLYG